MIYINANNLEFVTASFAAHGLMNPPQLVLDSVVSCWGRRHRNFKVHMEPMKDPLSRTRPFIKKLCSSNAINKMDNLYDRMILDDERVMHIFSRMIHDRPGHRIIMVTIFTVEENGGFAVNYTLYENMATAMKSSGNIVCISPETDPKKLEELAVHFDREVFIDSKGEDMTDNCLRRYLELLVAESKKPEHKFTNFFKFSAEEFAILKYACDLKYSYAPMPHACCPLVKDEFRPCITFEVHVGEEYTNILGKTTDSVYGIKEKHFLQAFDLPFELCPKVMFNYAEMIDNNALDLSYGDMFRRCYVPTSSEFEYPFKSLPRGDIHKALWYEMTTPIKMDIHRQRNGKTLLVLSYTFNNWVISFGYTLNDDARLGAIEKLEVTYRPISSNGLLSESNLIYEYIRDRFFHIEGNAEFVFRMALAGLAFIHDQGENIRLIGGRTSIPCLPAIIHDADILEYKKLYAEFDPKLTNKDEPWYKTLKSLGKWI